MIVGRTALAAAVGGVLTIACAGGDGPGRGLTGSVPWALPEEPRRPAIGEPEPEPPPAPRVEVVTHGTKLVAQGEDEVTVLTLLELYNRGPAPAPLPRTEVHADVVTPERRMACDAPEVVIEGSPILEPGERRLVWARTRCPVEGDEPQVVRSFVQLPDFESEAHDAGRAIVTAGEPIAGEAPLAAARE